MIRKFRNSEIKQFLSCPRQWWLRYGMGLSKKPVIGEESTKADIGTAYHRSLELHYSGGDAFGWLLSSSGLEDKDLLLVNRMVEGYLDWLEETGADHGLTVVGLERQLEVDFGEIAGDQVFVTGRLDMEVKDDWGFKKIIDNKSVQNLGQADLLYLDFQGRTYSLLRRMEGRPVQGFIHNQARRVLRSSRSTPPFYQRVEVAYNNTLLDSHEAHLRGVLEHMVRVARLLDAEPLDSDVHHYEVPPNPTRDCSWQCPFVHACPMMDDGSDWRGYLLEFFDKAGTIEPEREEG